MIMPGNYVINGRFFFQYKRQSSECQITKSQVQIQKHSNKFVVFTNFLIHFPFPGIPRHSLVFVKFFRRPLSSEHCGAISFCFHTLHRLAYNDSFKNLNSCSSGNTANSRTDRNH